MNTITYTFRTFNLPIDLANTLCSVAASRGINTNDLIVDILKNWKPPIYVIAGPDGTYGLYWNEKDRIYSSNINYATKYTEKQKAEMSRLPGINFTEVKE